jgi:tRNA pseudouridine55 synthase
MSTKTNPISGLLNIDKPKGITSHDVVARIRKLAGQHRVGHAGTLDPLATGVLLVCLGQATRLVEYLMASRKQYRATIRFGTATDTLDAEGLIVARSDPTAVTEDRLKAILPAFIGEIEQIPPVFSALKQGGIPLYQRARAGEHVKVAARPVIVYFLKWVTWQPPDLTLDITCSAGTYIRSLARDLGYAVGSVAHLAGLMRTASGEWPLAEAVPLETLEHEVRADKTAWQRYLYPPDRALAHLPKLILDEETALRIRLGQQVELVPVEAEATATIEDEAELLRVYTPTKEFLAILTRTQPGATLWRPKKVFHIG